MNKHSKGPWSWALHPSHGDHEDLMESLIDADGNEVLWLGDSIKYDQRSGYEPEPADKALIAAAPELLEVARAAALFAKSEALPTRQQLLESAQKAIAKARGES